MLLRQVYQIVLQQLHCTSFPLPLAHKLTQATQGTGGIYFVAVRTCLSHEGDNLPRFTPMMGYSNHSMDFRISNIWGTILSSCFEMSGVSSLKINCLWGQFWKIWTRSIISHIVAQQKAIKQPISRFGSIIRKVLGWSKSTLNFAMYLRTYWTTTWKI